MTRFFKPRTRGFGERLLQSFLLLVVIITLVVNLIYLTQMKINSGGFEDPSDDPWIKLNRGSKKDGTSSEIKSKRSDQLVEEQGKNVINLKATSGKDKAAVFSNGKEVFRSAANGRGLFIVVLNPFNGNITAVRSYDTYYGVHDEEIKEFCASLPKERIAVFMTVDDASYMLGDVARNVITNLGSQNINKLSFRDSWAFMTKISLGRLAEDLMFKQDDQEWGDAAVVSVNLSLASHQPECEYGSGDVQERRKEFCNKYDGYGNVCKCKNYEEIDFKPKQLQNNNIVDIPIAVIAANRPYLLYLLLRKLLNVPGISRNMITVYIDNEHNDEINSVCKLYNVAFVVHKPMCTENCRIAQHYKRTLTETFDKHPKANAMIILEEDLDVSDDIMDYFSQTFPLLEAEESLFCISAWNDQGYHHTVHDPALLFRTSTMPGLGWILKRSIYKNELEKKWPGPRDYSDWDVWLRLDENLKGRECIIPEISRTFHRGVKGLNMNEFFHNTYFKQHALNNATGVKFDVVKIKKDNYEKYMHETVSNAIVLDHAKNPCSHPDDFMPKTHGKTYVIYIKMEKSPEDDENVMTQLHKPKMHETWTNFARCMKIWDLSPRGLHNRAMKVWYKNNDLILVGVPESPYSIHKPKDVQPIFIQKQKDESS